MTKVKFKKPAVFCGYTVKAGDSALISEGAAEIYSRLGFCEIVKPSAKSEVKK